ncbi:glycosyltransferase [Aliifodinibius sp. S!AR15-10]|uniref:glycosyltransferase n=1 Tax=Aliifodinibius sp. S!AR15-10 TaxID=2950437 RepID=UPI0028666314|nr:glycosyltransferase [Aliifodinibius sp. S!AR15-10]MDR8392616.1 glycosyltransferase [Aliifodinibius sp. S!AR15-10]
MKIIFLSHTSRDSVFKVGSYHLSNEYARMGHQVLYVASSLSPFHFFNVGGLREPEYRESIKNRLRYVSPQKDENGVINLTPFVPIPFNKGIFSNPKLAIDRSVTLNGIPKKLKDVEFDQVDLVIQDRPELFYIKNFIHCNHWIYRPTDDYSLMSRGPGKEAMQALEKEICNYANQVIVTSEPLRQVFLERYNVSPSVVRNGVASSHFQQQRKIPPEYRGIDKPVILYVGSLDKRFDLDLLLATAKQSPDYHFVIVGPGGKKAIPSSIDNISALGPKPFADVPAYMQHADVGILPLKLIEANHARSPMKIYEYGICGLPVVSTPLRELEAREEDFVFFATTPHQFDEQINHCIRFKQHLAQKAKRASQDKSWQSKAKQILELADINAYD